MDKITANFAIHYSLIYPFPRKLANHNSMRKKDATKLAIKREAKAGRKRKKISK